MDEPLGALDALTREKMQSLVLKIWKETGKTIILITHSVEEALLLGEKVYVMAPRPGRIHKEYKLPFASMGLKEDLRDIKNNKEFVSKREEILSMIWDMEEEIMGKEASFPIISSSMSHIIERISSLLDTNSLLFLISLKSSLRPIDAKGNLYSLCILPGLGAIT